MSKLIRCTGKLAIHPYYMIAGNTNVYSIEELAYVIINNVYSLDETVMNEQLCGWVADELGLPDLARRMHDAMTGFTSLSAYVATILAGSGYCSHEQISEIKTILDEIGNKNEFFRRKHRADMLLSEKRYSRSIYEYNKLLNYYATKKEPAEHVGAVWHNMGTAYAGLFMYDKAADCFEQAFELNKEEASLTQYKYALYFLSRRRGTKLDRALHISSEELAEVGEDIERLVPESESDTTDRFIANVLAIKESGKISSYYGEIFEIMNSWKDECRKGIE